MLRRPLHILSSKLRRKRLPVERMKEKWVADFSKPEKSCFDIKPEISYNAYLEKNPPFVKGALFIGLKKKNGLAQLETANRVYVDQLIEARFRFDSLAGYCAAGIMFRIMEKGTYYLALFSSKGYFRLDAVNKNIPLPLVDWTEVSGLDEHCANLRIIAQGDNFIFMLNGKWIAEVRDSTIPGGHLGFALVSYDLDAKETPDIQAALIEDGFTCKAWLEYLSVDSRPVAVDAEYKKWKNSTEISAESRLRLAESFAALDHFGAAYNQILKAWKQREEAARSVMATYTEMRTRGELLFAARIASRIGQYETAEEYIDICVAMGEDSNDKLDALSEKAIILSIQNKYDELVGFLPEYIKLIHHEEDNARLPPLYALLGHDLWNLQEYKAAATAWDAAFCFNRDNGLYAISAADAYEKLGKNAEAFKRRLDGGNCFLQQEDYDELGILIPKLLTDGKKNWEAHALAGKWAFATGDSERAEAELAASEKLRRTTVTGKKPAGKSVQKTVAEPSEAGEQKTKPARTPKVTSRKTSVKEPDKKTNKKSTAKTKSKPGTSAAKPSVRSRKTPEKNN